MSIFLNRTLNVIIKKVINLCNVTHNVQDYHQTFNHTPLLRKREASTNFLRRWIHQYMLVEKTAKNQDASVQVTNYITHKKVSPEHKLFPLWPNETDIPGYIEKKENFPYESPWTPIIPQGPFELNPFLEKVCLPKLEPPCQPIQMTSAPKNTSTSKSTSPKTAPPSKASSKETTQASKTLDISSDDIAFKLKKLGKIKPATKIKPENIIKSATTKKSATKIQSATKTQSSPKITPTTSLNQIALELKKRKTESLKAANKIKSETTIKPLPKKTPITSLNEIVLKLRKKRTESIKPVFIKKTEPIKVENKIKSTTTTKSSPKSTPTKPFNQIALKLLKKTEPVKPVHIKKSEPLKAANKIKSATKIKSVPKNNPTISSEQIALKLKKIKTESVKSAPIKKTESLKAAHKTKSATTIKSVPKTTPTISSDQIVFKLKKMRAESVKPVPLKKSEPIKATNKLKSVTKVKSAAKIKSLPKNTSDQIALKLKKIRNDSVKPIPTKKSEPIKAANKIKSATKIKSAPKRKSATKIKSVPKNIPVLSSDQIALKLKKIKTISVKPLPIKKIEPKKEPKVIPRRKIVHDLPTNNPVNPPIQVRPPTPVSPPTISQDEVVPPSQEACIRLSKIPPKKIVVNQPKTVPELPRSLSALRPKRQPVYTPPPKDDFFSEMIPGKRETVKAVKPVPTEPREATDEDDSSKPDFFYAPNREAMLPEAETKPEPKSKPKSNPKSR